VRLNAHGAVGYSGFYRCSHSQRLPTPLRRKACDRSHGVSNLKILLHNPTAPGTGIIVMQ